MRSKFLIATSAAALVAGTTFVYAQGQHMKGQPDATSAQPQGQAEQHPGQPQQGKGQRGAQPQGQPAQSRGKAQADDPSKARAQGQLGREGDQQAEPRQGQQNEPRQGQQNRQQGQAPQGQQNRQGQAAQGERGGSGSATLTAEQRTRIHAAVISDRSAPRVTNVNFSLTVGTVVPRSVKVVAVAQPIIEIYPAWRGFLYFVVGDQVVIVDPNNHQIVAVIAA